MTTIPPPSGRNYQANVSQSLLDAAQFAGITLTHSCRTGRCKSCKATVRTSDTQILHEQLDIEDQGDLQIHTSYIAITYPGARSVGAGVGIPPELTADGSQLVLEGQHTSAAGCARWTSLVVWWVWPQFAAQVAVDRSLQSLAMHQAAWRSSQCPRVRNHSCRARTRRDRDRFGAVKPRSRECAPARAARRQDGSCRRGGLGGH
jgi:ferredoxin